MRGRKIDNNFMAQFIEDCALRNITSSEEIVLEAQKQINNIDLKIEEINFLKGKKRNLLNVIESFSNKKENKTETNILFYKIDNQNLAKKIVLDLKDKNNMVINFDKNINNSELIWCIKQLSYYKIINKTHNVIVKGQLFNMYLNLINENKC